MTLDLIASNYKETTMKTRKRKRVQKPKGFSTGSTLLNLSLTGHPDVGFCEGKLTNVIGDSSSGKTLLVLTSLAIAANDPTYDGYDLHYRDREAACEFDLKTLFGTKAARRIIKEDPSKDDSYFDTVEAFHLEIEELLQRKRPFVYCLDSLDALTDNEEKEKTRKKLVKFKKGNTKKEAGSYGTKKAKYISDALRQIVRKLKDTKSILIVVSQTRDAINAMSFDKKTRSGGRALKFYSTHEMWLAVIKTLAIERKKIKRVIGHDVTIKVTKNKITGKRRTVDMRTRYDYGVDDVYSNMQFLISCGHWKKTQNTITCVGLDFKGTEIKVIEHIETNNLEGRLSKIVAEQWNVIEEATKPNRKPRFS